MDKKQYSTPTTEVIDITASQMLATSIRIDRDQIGSDQLGNDRKDDRQWGNIWAD